MLTTSEVSQYIRLTLKQHELSFVSIEWMDDEETRGLAIPAHKKIKLDISCLESFARLKETLLHEMAHILDFYERGGSFVVNQRQSYHGKNWRKWCRILGCPARKIIP